MKAPIFTMVLLSISSILSYGQLRHEPLALELEGVYQNPKVSPDLKYILLAGGDMNSLYLYDVEAKTTKQISDNVASGYGYSWNDNSQNFYFREVPEGGSISTSNVLSYSISTNEASLNQEDIEAMFLPSFHGLDENGEDQFVVYNEWEDGQIYLIDLLTRERTQITNDAESQFYAPILSHDKQKVAIHKGNDIWIYSVNKSFTPYSIGEGIATEWSSDDQLLLGFSTVLEEEHAEEHHHEAPNTEVFLYDFSDNSKKLITNTEGIGEIYPAFYGKDIVIYTDAFTGTTGSKYITPQN